MTDRVRRCSVGGAPRTLHTGRKEFTDGERSGTVIVAVGHADLTANTRELVERELRARLNRIPETVVGLVRASAGLPLTFGRAVRAVGRNLVVLLPGRGPVPSMLPEPDRPAAGELLTLATEVRTLPFDPADRHSCVGADERLVALCRQVIAVWDGSPSDGRDATAHLVAFARTHDVPVTVLWPAGASRVRPPRPRTPFTRRRGPAPGEASTH